MPSQRDVVPDESDAAVGPIDLADATGWTAARRFPIVGIGASAGGLDAFKALLAATPPDTGMAFVLIQHLDPLHASLMAELLSSRTTMPVAPAAEGAQNRAEPCLSHSSGCLALCRPGKATSFRASGASRRTVGIRFFSSVSGGGLR